MHTSTIMKAWQWDPSLNRKSIYVVYTAYTHNLKLILYNVVNTFVSVQVIKFSICGVMLVLENKVLDFTSSDMGHSTCTKNQY